MLQCIIVNFFPTLAGKCGDQQEQGGLGLMEIGNEHIYYPRPVRRRYQQLRFGHQLIDLTISHPFAQRFQ
jgi:hypothetical protein